MAVARFTALAFVPCFLVDRCRAILHKIVLPHCRASLTVTGKLTIMTDYVEWVGQRKGLASRAGPPVTCHTNSHIGAELGQIGRRGYFFGEGLSSGDREDQRNKSLQK